MFLGYIDPGTGFTVLGAGGALIALLGGFLGFFLIFFKKIFSFFKRYWKWLLIMLGAVAIGAIIVTGVFMNKHVIAFDNKAVILGFDGLSPNILEPMMKEGLLPNFSALKTQGSYRVLETTNPSQSPVAWAGFATGKNPGKTCIFDFIERDPKTYGLTLSLTSIKNGKPERPIKTDCFWNYTSAAGIENVIIACPDTFPPDKIKGRMLSGMGVPDILGTQGTFTYYTSEPMRDGKDTGGKVFHVQRSPLMVINLLGPRIAKSGRIDHTKVPVKVVSQKGKNAVTIEYQNTKIELKTGVWSPWQEVTFDLGFFRKTKGIFKFYLVETEPDFKLYISPINLDPRQPFFAVTYPASYGKELTEAIGLYYTQGMPMDTWAVNEKRLGEAPFIELANEVLREKRDMLKFELSRVNKGILYCYFESPDIIQHMFWRYTDPEHPLYEKDAPEEYKQLIRSWYIKMDTVLGDVMRSINKDDTLIVLSDHGFDTFRRAAHVNTWLRENGYLVLKDKEAVSGGDLLVDIDWSGTKAYAIGFGSIYINQRGREASGIVPPGKETEDLKNEISRKLKTWYDEKYQQPVVHDVYSREEIFWGPFADRTPDLYIGFNIGYRASWQTALGAAPEDLIEDNLKKWSGTHLCDPSLIPGIFFTNRKVVQEKAKMYDVTPTILKAVGFKDEDIVAYDFDGRPLI